jgi:hypothetical protein
MAIHTWVPPVAYKLFFTMLILRALLQGRNAMAQVRKPYTSVENSHEKKNACFSPMYELEILYEIHLTIIYKLPK